MRPYRLIWCGLATLALAPIPGHGLGIRLADQDAEATARGNAFVATADNPSAIYYNPAGITQLPGVQLRAGVYAVTPGSQYRSNFGVQADTVSRWNAAPQVYATWSPEDRAISLGLGVYAPYGLSLEWPETTGFGILAIKGRITYLTVNPVAAVQIHPRLSIAAGPTFNYSDTELVQRNPFGPLLQFKGDGADYAFNAGVRWQPHDQHVLGVSYRAATSVNYEGTVAGFLSPAPSGAAAKFEFPQHVVLGWSYRPTPAWNIEFNADWTDWDRLDTVTLREQSGIPLALPFNWRSSWFYEWGLTRQLPKGYFVSGGYIFSENSVPDSSFNPVVPDSDRHIFSVGVGRKAKHWSWAVSYQAAYGPIRTVSGSNSPAPPVTADGRYESLSHALALSVGYSF